MRRCGLLEPASVAADVQEARAPTPWRRAARRSTKPVGRELVCPMCGKTWRRMSGQARYCSDECRRLAHQAYAPMAENPVRDAAIVAAVAAGELQRVVAARWGLTEGRVWQIVHRGQR